MADGRRDDGWESEGRLLGGSKLQINREEGVVCSSRASHVHLPALNPHLLACFPFSPHQEQMLRDPISLDLESVLIKVP